MSDCACSTVGLPVVFEQRLNGGVEGSVRLKHAARGPADLQQFIVGACAHHPVAVVHRSSDSQEGFRPGLLSQGGVGAVLVGAVACAGALVVGGDVREAANRGSAVPTADGRIISI